MLTEDYSVRLDAFEGPLDLLLHLIRRAEVDISAISIAQITDQYLKHLESLNEIDVEPAGEFLVTAATLVELKSRLLAPPTEGEEDAAAPILDAGSGDPAADLVRALLEYKRFRERAERLARRREEWRNRWEVRPLAVPSPPRNDSSEPPLDLEDLTLYDLVQAYARIAETVAFDRLGEHAIVDDDTPIELHAADVMERLKASAGPVSMHALFAGRSRAEVIGVFLALLELVRQRLITVAQNDLDREVTVSLATPGE